MTGARAPERAHKLAFLSSTSDLADCRAAAQKELDFFRYEVEWMERFPADPDTPVNVCRERVRQSSLFVCILGPSYGSIVKDDDRSFTEVEYVEAGLAKIPRLVFVMDHDFHADDEPCPPPGRGGARPFDQRQQEFLRRVRHDVVVERFSTPRDLMLKIGRAVHQLELRHSAAAAAKIHKGVEAHKTCDRSEEVGRFSDFFLRSCKDAPGRPQLILLAGGHGDSLESMVDRFLFDEVRRFFEKGKGGAVPAEVFTSPWMHHGDPAELRVSILRRLCDALDESYDEPDPTATALGARPALASYKVVPVLHVVHAEKWNRHTASLIEWYAKYWSGLEPRASGPLFLIFLAVVFPRGGARRPWPFNYLWPKAKASRELPAAAARAAAHVPCLLLERLRTPDLSDVLDWFSEHMSHCTAEERLRRSEKVIRDCAGRVSMIKIESQLKAAVEEAEGAPNAAARWVREGKAA